MKIPLQKFDKQGIGKITDFEFSEQELLWASLTIGAPSYASALQFINDAPEFAIQKWLALRSVIKIENQNLVLPITNYKKFEQSEKSVLSYWAGMIFSKLVAEKELGIPYMAHARFLEEDHSLTREPKETKSWPDLVGLDNSMNWHVIEAKGRKANPSPKEQKHFRDQAGRIKLIDDKLPKSKMFCITKMQKKLSIDLYDLEKTDNNTDEKTTPVNFSIKPLDMQIYFYKPFVEFFSNDKIPQVSTGHESIIYKRLTCFAGYKCYIGIMKDIFNSAKEEIIKTEKERKYKIARADITPIELIDNRLFMKKINEKETYIGRDGIVVKIIRD